ncbi:hypothetical protein EDEG_02189 [Edhazardia aedis USNM 41457]|uniref:Actin-related protein 5 n=1 Tax=Edhazardia aedis (strain USNM 41457) TaxID=1003232 RepID=J9DQ45_EDHAE|nr:hypothetical protein EDEG_02189 [Edhazardia aedis USNM 41457]|eukprot:EJW03472.1 hypothetical protein EDEG_02189 [Edhazardia aedis USNM 41457]
MIINTDDLPQPKAIFLPATYSKTLVIDNGTYTLKAGFHHNNRNSNALIVEENENLHKTVKNEYPQVIFRNKMYKSKFGFTLDNKPQASPKTMFDGDVIVNCEILEATIDYILEYLLFGVNEYGGLKNDKSESYFYRRNMESNNESGGMILDSLMANSNNDNNIDTINKDTNNKKYNIDNDTTNADDNNNITAIDKDSLISKENNNIASSADPKKKTGKIFDFLHKQDLKEDETAKDSRINKINSMLTTIETNNEDSKKKSKFMHKNVVESSSENNLKNDTYNNYDFSYLNAVKSSNDSEESCIDERIEKSSKRLIKKKSREEFKKKSHKHKNRQNLELSRNDKSETEPEIAKHNRRESESRSKLKSKDTDSVKIKKHRKILESEESSTEELQEEAVQRNEMPEELIFTHTLFMPKMFAIQNLSMLFDVYKFKRIQFGIDSVYSYFYNINESDRATSVTKQMNLCGSTRIIDSTSLINNEIFDNTSRNNNIIHNTNNNVTEIPTTTNNTFSNNEKSKIILLINENEKFENSSICKCSHSSNVSNESSKNNSSSYNANLDNSSKMSDNKINKIINPHIHKFFNCCEAKKPKNAAIKCSKCDLFFEKDSLNDNNFKSENLNTDGNTNINAQNFNNNCCKENTNSNENVNCEITNTDTKNTIQNVSISHTSNCANNTDKQCNKTNLNLLNRSRMPFCSLERQKELNYPSPNDSYLFPRRIDTVSYQEIDLIISIGYSNTTVISMQDNSIKKCYKIPYGSKLATEFLYHLLFNKYNETNLKLLSSQIDYLLRYSYVASDYLQDVVSIYKKMANGRYKYELTGKNFLYQHFVESLVNSKPSLNDASSEDNLSKDNYNTDINSIKNTQTSGSKIIIKVDEAVGLHNNSDFSNSIQNEPLNSKNNENVTKTESMIENNEFLVKKDITGGSIDTIENNTTNKNSINADNDFNNSEIGNSQLIIESKEISNQRNPLIDANSIENLNNDEIIFSNMSDSDKFKFYLSKDDSELTKEQIKDKRKFRIIYFSTIYRLKQKIEKIKRKMHASIEEQEEKLEKMTNLKNYIKKIKKHYIIVKKEIKNRERIKREIKNKKSKEYNVLMKIHNGVALTKTEEEILSSINEGEDQDAENLLVEQLNKYKNILEEYEPEFLEEINTVEIIKGYNINMDIELLRVSEALFRPSLIGMSQPGLTEVLQKFKDYKIKNTFVTGGFSSITNLKERLYSEIDKNSKYGRTNIVLAKDPVYDPFKGAAFSSAFPVYTIDEYLKYGADYLISKYDFLS